MTIRIGKGFWRFATVVIVAFTAVVVGRNAVHAFKIKHQIGQLRREAARYREKIGRDSTLLERLRYDDYLEEYARERLHMVRPGEQVYVVEERER